MLQMNLEYLDNETYVSEIIKEVKVILSKRKDMYNRYSRKLDAKEIKTPLEYYIANIASGYMGGKAPNYTIKQETNEERKKIIKNLFDKTVGENANKDEFQMLIDYVKDYNDDATFFYEIVKDYLTTGACAWLEYETNENDIVYTRLSSLQSVAIYDYSTPIGKIGGIRIWQEKDNNGQEIDKVEIITATQKRYYHNDKLQPKVYKENEEERVDVKWLVVPFNSVENPDGLAIFEPVLSLIDTFENVIKNNKHIFEYNDKAKLKITGFTPMNELFIEELDEDGNPKVDEDGNPILIKNPARQQEDKAIMEAPTFYTPDKDGDIAWIMKDINDTASENHKKTLLELIFLISSVPNIMETGTTEKTATEIERSFFPLEQYLIQADKLFKKELLAMWENIINRINVKKGTNFDFREMQIDLQRNLPQDKQGIINLALQLREVLSDETILTMLPMDIDVENEIAKKKQEAEDNFQENLEHIKQQGVVEGKDEENKEDEEVEKDVETTRPITK